MTITLAECDKLKTRELLGKILEVTLKDERVMFLVPAGQGTAVVQKNRVMLSRVRDSLKRKGKPIRRFTLHSTIHPHTDPESGKRHDAIVMWAARTLNHEMDELLEDMLKRDSI